MAQVQQTGALDGKVPTVNGVRKPLNVMSSASVWPTIVNVCATCQLPPNMIKLASKMLDQLKLAQANGDITSEDLARAAKGIYNGLPAIPEAADTLSRAKLIYDINKPRTGASLPARAVGGQAAVSSRAVATRELAALDVQGAQSIWVPGGIGVLEYADFGEPRLDGVPLQMADLVDRRAALAGLPAPMPGSTFGRLLAKDRSLEAQERWARSMRAAISEVQQGEK